MKILIIGNCQTRPVSSFVSMLCPEATVLAEIIVHLETDDNAEKNRKAMDSADVIFAQLVHDGYPVSHLETSKIRENYADKVVVWPNAFYVAQNPSVVCLSMPGVPRVTGPLDVYHLIEILSSWQNGLSIQACIEKLMQPDSTDYAAADICALSLNGLKHREQACDVKISDYVASHWLNKKLFHVFNHPTNHLLVELASRLCQKAGLTITNNVLPETTPEALDRVVPPSLPAIQSALGVEFETTTSSKGFTLDITDKTVKLGEKCIIPIEQLVELFYVAYDAQLNKQDVLSYTPNHLHPSVKPAAAA